MLISNQTSKIMDKILCIYCENNQKNQIINSIILMIQGAQVIPKLVWEESELSHFFLLVFSICPFPHFQK